MIEDKKITEIRNEEISKEINCLIGSLVKYILKGEIIPEEKKKEVLIRILKVIETGKIEVY